MQQRRRRMLGSSPSGAAAPKTEARQPRPLQGGHSVANTLPKLHWCPMTAAASCVFQRRNGSWGVFCKLSMFVQCQVAMENLECADLGFPAGSGSASLGLMLLNMEGRHAAACAAACWSWKCVCDCPCTCKCCGMLGLSGLYMPLSVSSCVLLCVQVCICAASWARQTLLFASVCSTSVC